MGIFDKIREAGRKDFEREFGNTFLHNNRRDPAYEKAQKEREDNVGRDEIAASYHKPKFLVCQK